MPQIPIFTPNQRIDASTPVAAINTTDARMVGEATEGFGRALASLGDTLDRTAKKAAAQEDAYLLKAAMGQMKIDMLMGVAAQKEAPILPDDDPSGITGAQRFQQTVKQMTAKHAANLPTRLKAEFEAMALDESVSYNAQVLAGETAKREKNVMVLRQDNVNKKASLARLDSTQLPVLLAELRNETEADQVMPAVGKPKFLQDSSQELIRGAIQGHALDGRWDRAEQILRDNAAYFDADGFKKEVDALRVQRNDYYNFRWNQESRNRTRKNDMAKEARDKKLDLVIAGYTAQGVDDSAIPFMVRADPFLSTALQNRILERQALGQAGDASYEVDVMDRYAQGENPLDSVRAAQESGLVSLNRGQKLINNIKALDSARSSDPAFEKAFEQGRKLIENFKEPRLFDPTTQTYRQPDDATNGKARAMYAHRAAKLASEGKATPDALEAIAYDVLRTQYAGQTDVVPVQGLSASALRSTDKIKEAAEDLKKRFKNGEFDTPEKQQQLQQMLQGLKLNEVRARFREDLQKHSIQRSGNR